MRLGRFTAAHRGRRYRVCARRGALHHRGL